jgi:hypothetical protein
VGATSKGVMPVGGCTNGRWEEHRGLGGWTWSGGEIPKYNSIWPIGGFQNSLAKTVCFIFLFLFLLLSYVKSNVDLTKQFLSLNIMVVNKI